MSRAGDWYRGWQPFPRITIVLSVADLMLIAVMVIMVRLFPDSPAAAFAFSLAIGFGAAVTGWLTWVLGAWYRASRSRRTK